MAAHVRARFFHSSAADVRVVPSGNRGLFERPSDDGSGFQRSGIVSHAFAPNCYEYTQREASTVADGTRNVEAYIHENCDVSLFDSLDCLGGEFLGSSAADLSFGYLRRPVAAATYDDDLNCKDDSFENKPCHDPNDKGGLSALFTKSNNSSRPDDNDEIHFGHSAPAAIPEDNGQSWQLGDAKVHQSYNSSSTPTCCNLNLSFTTDGTCSPAQSPVNGLALSNGFWEAPHKTDDPGLQRRPRELSQESDVSVIMKLSPVKPESLPNVSTLAAKPEELQQHASTVPVNGESSQGTLPRDLSLVMSMMQQDTKGAAVAQQPAAQPDNSASVAELLNLPDLIQPTDASSERCKSSIQTVLGKRKLVSSSGLNAPIGSHTKIGQSGFYLEDVVVESIQYGLGQETANPSLKPGHSAAKRQEALREEVQELEADNVLLHGRLKEFSSLVKGVWDQNRQIQEGLASSGIARSPLDMTLYMTATAASNKDIENKLSGKLESGTMSMELLFNKLSGGSATGLPWPKPLI